jgi:hypothetical protein
LIENIKSVWAELVEALPFLSEPNRRREAFDKLRPDGV